METPRNQALWRKAKRRVAFKLHLRTYMIVIGGLWLLYLLINYNSLSNPGFPWPIFPMLGWGIGLVSHYFTAYGNFDEHTMAQREYDRLQRE